MIFQKAVRHKRKLRATIDGPTGSGKTYTALELATGLSKTGKVLLLDTEYRSAELYADEFDFAHAPLEPPYTPSRYIEIIRAARDYDVLIIDSLSHAWEGKGGVLEMHGNVTAASSSKNSYTAWRDITPKHNDLIDAILAFPGHVITTMRSKMEYIMTEGGNGKKGEVKRVGMAPIQRAGTEYEFDLVLDMSAEGNFATVSKKRMAKLFNDGPFRPSRETGKLIREWLESGSPNTPARDDAAAGRVLDWVATMEAADSIDTLGRHFAQAVEEMKLTADKEGLLKVVQAKDKRKLELIERSNQENELNNTQDQGR